MDVKVQPNEATRDHGDTFALSLTAKAGRIPGKKKPVIITITLVLVAALGAGYKFWSDANDKNKTAAGINRAVLTVELTPVKSVDFERKLLVSGTVSAWDPVQVGSEVSGLRVEKIAVDEGARVKKGQVMAMLNSAIGPARSQASSFQSRFNQSHPAQSP
jgi:multidrug efflux pump subunit AcrA (membrane-fusion protein)